eukprot:2733811-Amphidinium_carterae.1
MRYVRVGQCFSFLSLIKDYRQAGEPDLRRIKRKGQAHEWFYTEKCREANASLSEACCATAKGPLSRA